MSILLIYVFTYIGTHTKRTATPTNRPRV